MDPIKLYFGEVLGVDGFISRLRASKNEVVSIGTSVPLVLTSRNLLDGEMALVKKMFEAIGINDFEIKVSREIEDVCLARAVFIFSDSKPALNLEGSETFWTLPPISDLMHSEVAIVKSAKKAAWELLKDFQRKMQSAVVAILCVFILFLTARSAEACTVDVDIRGDIGPATLDLVKRVEKFAAEKNCKSILLSINTPGGSLATTRSLVENILNSEIPFLCFITPAGAHAGSAGAILMQACHFSGGVTTTNLGAATPVSAGGQDIQKDLRNKIVNDTISFVEGLAELRGRNKVFAKDIVENAKAVTAEEAKKLNAIEWVGDSKVEFLSAANQKSVKLRDNKIGVIETGELLPFALDVRFKVMDVLMNPQTAYLMFMGSLALIYFELTHPGVVAPGVIGGIGLVVSMISLDMLEVAWGGVALILFGLVLFALEAFITSYGVLGIGGVVSFVLGSLLLFDPQTTGIEIPTTLIASVTAVLTLILGAIMYLALSTMRLKKTSGFQELIGKVARVTEVNEFGHEGFIEVGGEYWKFHCEHKVHVGDSVKLSGHKGFVFTVRKHDS